MLAKNKPTFQTSIYIYSETNQTFIDARQASGDLTFFLVVECRVATQRHLAGGAVDAELVTGVCHFDRHFVWHGNL